MAKKEKIMRKDDFITKISEKTMLPKKTVKMVLDAEHQVLKEALKKGYKVRLVGFGTYELKKRKERKGVNPKTGEPIVIPAKEVPTFKFSKKFLDK